MPSHEHFEGRWLELPDVLLFGGQDREAELNIFDNFYEHTFELNERTYHTIEHAFQAAKFWQVDAEYAEKIRRAQTPMQAKELGQQRKLPVDAMERWRDGGADRAMRAALEAKYGERILRERLLSTGDRPLAEQVNDDPTWDDRRWGIGRAGDGENKLGKLLMAIRDEIRLNDVQCMGRGN